MKKYSKSLKIKSGGKSTSWGEVATWYDELLETKDDTYQKEVILPKLLKLMGKIEGQKMLDLACGQGFFSREFAKGGAIVTGVDVSPELIDLAKKNSKDGVNYIISPANNLAPLANETFDKVVIILALQNMNNLDGAISECKRVLKDGGKLYLVLNHPAFRVPKKSDWGFDDRKGVQYRRVEQYLSESLINIDMHPGKKDDKEKTVSFHRPLESYFKSFFKNGFVVSRLEEWVSHKKSQNGPRQKAEDRARREIPIFMCLAVEKR